MRFGTRANQAEGKASPASSDSAAYSSGVFRSTPISGSAIGKCSILSACACFTSRAFEEAGALRNASINARPASSGCPCRPFFSGATAHLPAAIACSNAARRCSSVDAAGGGQSTGIIIAAWKPHATTSRSPVCSELNCPRSGSGFTTSSARQAEITGPNAAAFFPATTITASVCAFSAAIAAESSVWAGEVPSP